MDATLFFSIIAGVMIAATPLVFASLGELVVERSGVLNLGVEGMMVMGAVSGFAAAFMSGSAVLGLLAAIAAGAAMALLFGALTQVLSANQVASGLALTIFGLGLSALIGQGFTGKTPPRLPTLYVPGLAEVPVIGRAFRSIDMLVVLSFVLTVAIGWFFRSTRTGLTLRAIGDNPEAAHAIGTKVVRYRLAALLFGGAMAGLGGAYLSLVQTPFWAEKMTAGRGWIALALVVFATWQPARALFGAYLFGGITILQLHGQGLGIKLDAHIMSMLPYIATIVALVLISRDTGRLALLAPRALGKPFEAAR
jgi:general nucleoside transport system permease protein